MDKDKQGRLFQMPRGQHISVRDMLFAWWPAFLIVIIGFVVAYQFVQPAPPDTVVIATGAQDGAYFAYANRYREILSRNDVTLDIRPTSGSVENFGLLKDDASGVDVGFVQGGIGSAEDAPDLISLGSMYFEPLWVFYRSDKVLDRLTQLAGKRIAVGPAGSGTRRIAMALLAANGVPMPNGKSADLTGETAANTLQQGHLDAVFLVASPRAAAVIKLLHDQTVRLMSFTHAEAYTRHFPHLSVVLLPKGGIDLKRDIPSTDVQLLATTANLIVRDDLHPAIIGLLAAAATEIHSAPGLFQRKGDFPSTRDVDFPISKDADRYYKSGPPFLLRFLPFWAAILVDRMIVMLVPAIALLIPLVKILPALYNWRIRSRLFRNYGELRFLEDELSRFPLPEKIAGYLARLDKIEEQVNQMRIPLAFHDQMYTLRTHIQLVRARIEKYARPTPA